MNLRQVQIGMIEMRGMPHTVKVETHQNELVVHVALLHGPDAKVPGGVLLVQKAGST